MTEITREEIEEALMRARLEWIALGRVDPSQFEKLESLVINEIKTKKEEYNKREKERRATYEDWVSSVKQGTEFALIESYNPRKLSILRVNSSFLDNPKYKFLKMSGSYPLFSTNYALVAEMD